MRRGGIGLILLSACTTLPATSDIESSIVGGQNAQSSEFPSVVALENSASKWFCTGTLIDKDWILTAAHCVEGETAAGTEIRFDDTNVNDTTGGKVVKVAEIHANPGYDGVAWDNDIALIKLATSVTDRAVTPIHRPVVAPASDVVQVGYGDSSDQGGGGRLRKLSTKTIDCAMVMDTTITGTHVVCFDQRDGNGTCYGDSGGPSFVAVNGKLEVGAVTSGGTVDSCLAGFDIQTSVNDELAWVDMTMGVAQPPPPPPPDPDPTPDPNGDPGSNGDPKASDGGGCNTSGGSAGLLLVGLAALLARRRR